MIGKNNPQFKGGRPKCIDCGKQLKNFYAKRCRFCENEQKRYNLKYRIFILKKVIKSNNLKPNKKEKLLTKLLNKILPNEYKYVGSGKIIIGSFIPDFININGQKKIIEFFGDYWHKNTQEKDKRKIKNL